MNKVLIIAEAGVNHNGSLKNAKELIDVAVKAGVDYVKFQTFKADALVSKEAKKADYQTQNLFNSDISQYEMLKSLELSEDDHTLLIDYATSKGIKFFSTAFDVDGLDYLNSLHFDRFKVPSGEITNYPYLKKVASFGKPVILSTGMSTLEEIAQAIEVLVSGDLNSDDIVVLHCNTEYPTPMEDVNLHAMLSIANAFKVKVGYSDHTLGIEVPIAAVALGACVIEKHFTLDREMEGPDHKASLEPSELNQMVSSIRNIELAISGNGEKNPSNSEEKNKAIARKSIHVSRDLAKDHVMQENDLISLRPGDGISPMEWHSVVGKKTLTNLKKHEKLAWKDITI